MAGIVAELRRRCAMGPLYGAGNSNGAGLMQRMGANAGPGLPFRGIIAQATHMMCSPEQAGEWPYTFNHPQAAGPKLCYMSVHGDQDTVIPYGGGPLFGSQQFTLCSSKVSNERWAAHNGCNNPTQLPTPTLDGAVEHYQFDCPTIPTEHYKILGGGHGVQKDVGTEVHFAFIRKCEAAWAKQEAAVSTAGSPQTTSPAGNTGSNAKCSSECEAEFLRGCMRHHCQRLGSPAKAYAQCRGEDMQGKCPSPATAGAGAGAGACAATSAMAAAGQADSCADLAQGGGGGTVDGEAFPRSVAGTTPSANVGTVYIVGDSCLDGKGTTQGQIEAQLSEALGTKVVNNAVGGANMDDIAQQPACSSDPSCQWSVVGGGMNPGGAVVMQHLVDREIKANRKVIIHGYPASPEATSPANEATGRISGFMDSYLKIAAAQCNVFVLDYRNHPKLLAADPSSTNYRAQDNSHPNGLAGAEFAKSIAGIIKQHPAGDCGGASTAPPMTAPPTGGGSRAVTRHVYGKYYSKSASGAKDYTGSSYWLHTPDASKHEMPSAGWPVVVEIHGGGFTGGAAHKTALRANTLPDRLVENGIALLSLDYRLLATKYFYQGDGGAEQEEEFIDVDADGKMTINPKYKMSDYKIQSGRLEFLAKCVYSAVQGFDHMLANAPELNVDPAKVGFIANSAGGAEVNYLIWTHHRENQAKWSPLSATFTGEQLDYPVQNLLSNVWKRFADDLGSSYKIADLIRESQCSVLLMNPWCGKSAHTDLCNQRWNDDTSKFCGAQFGLTTLGQLVAAQTWPTPQHTTHVGPSTDEFEAGIMYLWNTTGQMMRHTPANFNLWIYNSGGNDVTHHALYAKLYADLMGTRAKANQNNKFAAYWADWKDMSPSSESKPGAGSIANYKESPGLGWRENNRVKAVAPASAKEQLLWHCRAFGMASCSTADSSSSGGGSTGQCAYDQDVPTLMPSLDDCPPDACTNGYVPGGAGSDTAIVCYHKTAKKCGCEAGCQNTAGLVQCVQKRPATTVGATTCKCTNSSRKGQRWLRRLGNP